MRHSSYWFRFRLFRLRPWVAVCDLSAEEKYLFFVDEFVLLLLR